MMIVLKAYKECSRQETGSLAFMPRKLDMRKVNGEVWSEEELEEAVSRQSAQLCDPGSPLGGLFPHREHS